MMMRNSLTERMAQSRKSDSRILTKHIRLARTRAHHKPTKIDFPKSFETYTYFVGRIVAS